MANDTDSAGEEPLAERLRAVEQVFRALVKAYALATVCAVERDDSVLTFEKD